MFVCFLLLMNKLYWVRPNSLGLAQLTGSAQIPVSTSRSVPRLHCLPLLHKSLLHFSRVRWNFFLWHSLREQPKKKIKPTNLVLRDSIQDTWARNCGPHMFVAPTCTKAEHQLQKGQTTNQFWFSRQYHSELKTRKCMDYYLTRTNQ